MTKKKKKVKVTKWKITNLVFVLFLLVMIGLYAQYCYLSLSEKIYGENIKKFAAKRNSVSVELVSERGKIFDTNGDPLAINVTSYNVIAYLDPSRDKSKKHPDHVIDKEETAKKLSEVLSADYDYILKRLNSKLYQVQFGKYGRNITELKKIEIEKLKIPGIGFEKTDTRYYPNGNFASQIVGYAKSNDEGKIEGLLGIESKYNKKLKGINGHYTYQQDSNGYRIPDTPEEKEDAVNGSDVYLTIDSSVQRFVESAITSITDEYKPEWALIEVMDAKTGAILGSGTNTGFDPNNIPEDMSYENPLVSYSYEPGSTMKIYTYICALEKGVYNGSDKFKSGSFKIEDDTINDWKPEGWGEINYDQGFAYSSNVGIANLITKNLSLKELKSCQQKFGFGKKTNVELYSEKSGSLDYKYPIEIVAAGYGQGILTTPVQHLQALSAIANNGYMVKPHIISKIVNSDGEEKKVKTEKSEEKIISQNSVNKIKDLMYSVINDDWATGHKYKIDGYDIIGKTGTAQIYEKGGYLTGETDYISSIALMYPKDNPQVIIYAAVKKPDHDPNNSLVSATKGLIQNMAKYQGTFSDYEAEINAKTITLPNYQGKKVSEVTNDLARYKLNIVKIGKDKTIVDQYPKKGNKITFGDRLFLITNSKNITMPNMTNWSKIEVQKFCELTNIKCEYEGTGYVTGQSISENSPVGNLKVTLSLKNN